MSARTKRNWCVCDADQLVYQAQDRLPSSAADVQSKIVPGVTHWQSPNFYGYYPSNGSTAGFLGEMLSGGFNIIGFSWITSPAATELEIIVMDWLGKLLKLPNEFLSSGNFISSQI